MLDAHNLAWKLALVADGHAPDRLLDTYGQERGPVASGVMELTDRMVGLLTMRNRAKRAVRDTVIPIATRLPAAQRRAARRLSQVSVAYPSSPLVEPGGHRRGPTPGERLPDVQVRTQHGPAPLYRLLGSGRHVLIVSGPEVRAAFESAGLHIYSHLVDVVEGDPKGVFALVRPDGILGASGSRSETRRVLDYLHRLCGADEPKAERRPREASTVISASASTGGLQTVSATGDLTG